MTFTNETISEKFGFWVDRVSFVSCHAVSPGIPTPAGPLEGPPQGPPGGCRAHRQQTQIRLC